MDISEFISAHELVIRLGAFFSVLLAMAVWEIATPRRPLSVSKARRWTANLGIVVFNTILVRLLFPLAGVGMAAYAADRGFGLFNNADLPYWLAMVGSVVALDFAIYLQHVLFHAVPVLWRLHRVHHADLDFDVTTGARFHPIEIALSMLIKFVAILVIGPPVTAVVLFEMILNAMAMFNHGNVRIPHSVDRALRWFIVTPDMHRVHHSVERAETDSNFGFNLSLWDRVLGTYRPQPAKGHEAMIVGIAEYRDPSQCATLFGMLALPFRGTPPRIRRGLDVPHESY
jgi:sterol desaturase/sphingolipid hydroxylase (fatty acid hydroxylase superfamily)